MINDLKVFRGLRVLKVLRVLRVFKVLKVLKVLEKQDLFFPITGLKLNAIILYRLRYVVKQT